MPGAKELDPGGSLEEYIGDLVREARRKMLNEKGVRWTQQELAIAVFTNDTRISEVERGEDPPDLELARKLEATLKMPYGALTNLVRILRQENVRDYAKPYIRHRSEATAIHEFSIGIPGLLQTAGYARGAMEAGLAGDEAQIEDFVSARMDHRKLLDKASPPWLVAIIDEAALRRETGGKDAMREQLAHLIEMGKRRTVNIQVLPAQGVAVAGSFTLLTRKSGTRTAYTEGFNTGSYVEDQAEVLRFQRVYDLLQQSALSTRDSTELMRAVAKDHE
ncbi:Scr1 family TA system antitoxin-like transcriptional regulator [Streptomyces lavendulae]|uniref:helix-turn-helix domain-containing protein n=1 Tax=Streptomyces lavendulae TaxID=1914 RepID=UPI0036A04453